MRPLCRNSYWLFAPNWASSQHQQQRRRTRRVGSGPIENPQQFRQAAGQLLQQVQELDRHVSNVFASGTSGEAQASQDDLVAGIIRVIPLQPSTEIQSFAMELSSSATHSASTKRTMGMRKRSLTDHDESRLRW